MIIVVGIIVILVALTVSASVVLVQRSEVRQTENVLKILDIALQEWEAKADRKLTWGENDVPQGSRYDMSFTTPHVLTITEVLAIIRRDPGVQAILAEIDADVLVRYDLDTADDEAPLWIDLPTLEDEHADLNLAQAKTICSFGGRLPNGLSIHNELVVLDAWGTPIRAVHPGRVTSPAFCDETDDPEKVNRDGTVFVDKREALKTSCDGNGSPFNSTELVYGAASERRVRFLSAGPDGSFGDLSAEHDDIDDEVRARHEAAHDNVYSYAIEDHAHDE